jgi:hypothetical protein
VPSAKLGITYTAEDDPNHLLGRPNGYASKVSFTDSRVDQKLLEGQRPDAIDAGGSVEVYPDADDTARCAKYIQDLQRRRRSLAPSTPTSTGQCWCGCPGSSPPRRPTSTRPLSTPLKMRQTAWEVASRRVVEIRSPGPPTWLITWERPSREALCEPYGGSSILV